ncbi:unnamed protein product [Lactuca virosa]|uniref:Uncharacterized protein n=1 Tax=Lactuca virosa TaxID=75947 RepID=A0AAU9M7X7_9ASTR|nr:unnamed protein product [Lactuca virosa]
MFTKAQNFPGCDSVYEGYIERVHPKEALKDLNDLSDPPAPDAISSERASEDPVTTVFHGCLIDPDSEIKHVEDEAEVPHSEKPESETITGGLPEKVPEDPPLEKENPKGLSAAGVFQQKLFGSELGRFMAPTIDSLVVIPIPIPSDTTTRNEEPLETTSTDMEILVVIHLLIYYATTFITRKEATMPTLVTLSSSLPQLQHPFAMTSVLKSPFETGVVSDEEALDKARSCLMEGMHLLNEVYACTKAHT